MMAAAQAVIDETLEQLYGDPTPRDGEMRFEKGPDWSTIDGLWYRWNATLKCWFFSHAEKR